MEEARAIAKYVRISSLKVKKVADLVQGKNAKEAMNVLTFVRGKGSEKVREVLKSAMTNARNNSSLDPESFRVKALIGKGSTFKKTRPRARGRADLVKRRTSHITIILES